MFEKVNAAFVVHSHEQCKLPPKEDCHDLQYYMNDAAVYFSSNSQLNFSPGLHYLDGDLTIRNIHNFAMKGCLESTIVCRNISEYCVRFISVTNFSLTNLLFKNFTSIAQPNSLINEEPLTACIMILNCVSLKVFSVTIEGNSSTGLLSVNLMRESFFSKLSSSKLAIHYTSTNSTRDAQLIIDRCSIFQTSTFDGSAINVLFVGQLLNVSVIISKSTFMYLHHTSLAVVFNGTGINTVTLDSCHFKYNINRMLKSVVKFHFSQK